MYHDGGSVAQEVEGRPLSRMLMFQSETPPVHVSMCPWPRHLTLHCHSVWISQFTIYNDKFILLISCQGGKRAIYKDYNVLRVNVKSYILKKGV